VSASNFCLLFLFRRRLNQWLNLLLFAMKSHVFYDFIVDFQECLRGSRPVLAAGVYPREPAFSLLLSSLWTLSTVLRAALCAVGYSGGIQCTTHDVVTYTWKVLHTATANQHDGVLLKVVTLAGDVTVDFF
jgi:hypothetical protein